MCGFHFGRLNNLLLPPGRGGITASRFSECCSSTKDNLKFMVGEDIHVVGSLDYLVR